MTRNSLTHWRRFAASIRVPAAEPLDQEASVANRSEDGEVFGSMVFEFGDCELDLARGELRRGGELRHVEPQVFAVLTYLVQHRDRLVSSAELLDRVWRRRFVTPGTLNSRLKAARQAIGDDGRAQTFIRTLRGRGFRFVASVRVRRAASQGQSSRNSAATPAVIGTPAVATRRLGHSTLEESLRGFYDIDRELGRGGMATVYLARDLRHQRSVALKVLRLSLIHHLTLPTNREV
jgi:DNA-binding winged helix-turn-helix (wHTH) protein